MDHNYYKSKNHHHQQYDIAPFIVYNEQSKQSRTLFVWSRNRLQQRHVLFKLDSSINQSHYPLKANNYRLTRRLFKWRVTH